MQRYSEPDQLSRERANAAIIKQAIHDRACLTGTHVEFRVRFAPHVLGRDENAMSVVVGLEYGGLTLGRPHWVWFGVHRLRGLQRNGDPWPSASMQSKPQLGLSDIEASVEQNPSKLFNAMQTPPVNTVQSSRHPGLPDCAMGPGRPLDAKRILVVEDDYLVAGSLCDAIQEAGAVPLGPVAGAAAAVELAMQEALDGVLLDVKLRDGNGLTVANHLRAANVPIVLVTNYEPAALAPYLQRLPYVRKPASPRDLVDKATAAFGRSYP